MGGWFTNPDGSGSFPVVYPTEGDPPPSLPPPPLSLHVPAKPLLPGPGGHPRGVLRLPHRHVEPRVRPGRAGHRSGPPRQCTSIGFFFPYPFCCGLLSPALTRARKTSPDDTSIFTKKTRDYWGQRSFWYPWERAQPTPLPHLFISPRAVSEKFVG